MAQTQVSVARKPIWIDLASSDAAASREFYSKVFGWNVEVETDPQFGGYGIARLAGKDVAGIGPQMQPGAPSAWSIYIGTDDAEALAKKVVEAGGTVAAPPMKIGDSGSMVVFQDPAGAFISAWQPETMRGFTAPGPNTFGWPELSARGFDRAAAFYARVFGWEPHVSQMAEAGQPYTEFHLGSDSIAGGMEMAGIPGPSEMPSHWTVYFEVEDVDASHARAIASGATETIAPTDFPGGRFSLLTDPQGASFGLLKTTS